MNPNTFNKIERLLKGESFITKESGNSMLPIYKSNEPHLLTPITWDKCSVSESDYDFILSEYKKHNRSIIDCGINEDLFLAIASLRDDSDVGQWFVIDTEAYTDINKGDWFKSTDVNGKYHVGTKIDPLYCHKATVSEIIEHFK